MKRTVWPWSTLMSVAKPWMLESPAPLTSHSLGGLPGLEFSQTIGLRTGGSQGAAEAVPVEKAVNTTASSGASSSKRPEIAGKNLIPDRARCTSGTS